MYTQFEYNRQAGRSKEFLHVAQYTDTGVYCVVTTSCVTQEQITVLSAG
jgi:hypothetical protein